jgi:hypothetical protein
MLFAESLESAHIARSQINVAKEHEGSDILIRCAGSKYIALKFGADLPPMGGRIVCCVQEAHRSKARSVESLALDVSTAIRTPLGTPRTYIRVVAIKRKYGKAHTLTTGLIGVESGS